MGTHKTVRFIHTADIHFGVENYGRIDPKTGIHTRLLDFEKALSLCIDHAIEQDVDMFLFSGDAYKTAYPTPTQQKLLMRQLFRLREKNIPVVIVVGNHDHPLSFGRAHALDVFGNLPLDGFFVFSRPGVHEVKTKNGIIQVVGIPWPMRNNILANTDHQMKSSTEITKYISEQVGKIIRKLASELKPELPAVLAGHLTVSSGVFSGSEKTAVYGTDPIFLPSQLAIQPFDYVALGHLHRNQNLNKSGIPVVYAGSPERVDFGERKEPKGYCMVKIENKQASYDFIELPVRPMIQIEIEIDPHKEQTEQVISQINKHDISDAIIKVLYHIPDGTPDRVDLAEIQKLCRKAHYVTAITPVYTLAKRAQRAVLSQEMSTSVMLEKYFATQSYDEKMKKRLTKKAHELVSELEELSERGDESFEDEK